jgi:type VI secretion system protein ImpJ
MPPMSTGGQIHWYEGLFLQPQHLQAMQRDLIDRMAVERRLHLPFAYGVVESDLSRDALENKTIRFDRLRAVMPSGLEIDVPETTDLAPLDISKMAIPASGSLTLKLAVPVWYPLRANTTEVGTADDPRARRRYRVRESEFVDENSGRNPQPVQVRRINARLIADGDDETDLEVIPLVRVRHPSAGDVGLPRRDDDFFPPCLVMEGWPPLRDLVQELVDQVEATRVKLVKEITRDGLLGELCALQPDDDQYDVADYNHDDSAGVFLDLVDRIRGFLGEVVKGAFVTIPLAREQRAHVAAGIPPEHLALPEYYLAIASHLDPAEVTRLVHNLDKFKLMPRSKAFVAVRGVPLQFDHHPPGMLPSGAGVSYFRVVRGQDGAANMWGMIQREQSLSVTYPGVDSSDFQITLYGMLP